MQRASATRGLRFLPKLTLAITTSLIVSAASYAADVFTDPVGFISLTAVPSGLSLWGLGMTQLPALRGTLGTAVGTQVPVNSTLTANQFTRNTTAGAVAYFIEVTSGPNAGLMDDIVSNNTTAVFTATDDSGLSISGQTFKIYPHWTPDTVLGTPAQSGLVGGSATPPADAVIVWNPVAQNGTAVYYYRTNTNGAGPGWRNVVEGNAILAGTNVWYLDQGIQVLRNSGTTNVVTKLVGGVKLGSTVIPIAPGPNGLTLAGWVYASSTTVDGLGLFPGVLGGSATPPADSVQIWNAATQSAVAGVYYYRTNTNGSGPGWRNVLEGNAILAGTNSIPLGSIIKVQRVSGGGFNWVPVQPY